MSKQSDSDNNVPDAKETTIKISSKYLIKEIFRWVSLFIFIVNPLGVMAVTGALAIFSLMEYKVTLTNDKKLVVQLRSKQVASTNKHPFNCFGWVVLFPEDIRSNLVDLWNRWVIERGRLYAFFQMCLYLIKMVDISALSILLQGFKRRRSSTQVSLRRKS